MRAFHMPSLPEMPIERLHSGSSDIADTKQMKLKVLYSLDDNTNFLARSLRTSEVRTARIPIPGQQNIMTLGVVNIKDALAPVLNSSPELFRDLSWDYSVYVKDISEEDEPFVGHGLISMILNNSNDDEFEEQMIPGRVCSNFTALLSSKTPSETLEIKLRFAKVKRQDSTFQQLPSQQQQRTLPQINEEQLEESIEGEQSQSIHKKSYRRSSLSKHQTNDKNSSDTENEYEEENIKPKFIQPKHPKQQQQQQQQQPASNMPKMTRFVNNNPAPKAARTQSLPVFENMMKPPLPQTNGKPIETFPADSIALRIYMADKNSKAPTNKVNNFCSNDYIQNNVALRFSSDFIKSTSTPSSKEQKKKSRKTVNNPTPSYATSSASSSKKDIPEEHQLYQSCFNCKTLEAKGWKWNESEDLSKRGLLCSLCYTYLKDKGVMRPKRLFNKSTKTRDRKLNVNSSSSPSSNLGNDTTPATTPIRFNTTQPIHQKPTHPSSSSYLDDSSDPLNGFDDMMNDLDFQYGPLTDIDPLPPQQTTNIADKENIPPVQQKQQQQQQQTSIALQLQEYHEQRRQQKQQQPQLQQTTSLHQPSPIRATKQTSFEKMLTKSFSGIVPSNSNDMSPSEWMNTFFTEPTPKDQTPKDSPKDITTCNTLPCNEESPVGLTPVNLNNSNSNNTLNAMSGDSNDGKDGQSANKMKASTMPSSPFLTSQENDEIQRTDSSPTKLML